MDIGKWFHRSFLEGWSSGQEERSHILRLVVEPVVSPFHRVLRDIALRSERPSVIGQNNYWHNSRIAPEVPALRRVCREIGLRMRNHLCAFVKSLYVSILRTQRQHR